MGGKGSTEVKKTGKKKRKKKRKKKKGKKKKKEREKKEERERRRRKRRIRTMQSAYVASSSSSSSSLSSSSRMGRISCSNATTVTPRASSRRGCYASMSMRARTRAQQLSVNSRKMCCEGTAVSSVGILEYRPRSSTSASSVSISIAPGGGAVRCRAATAHKSVARADLAMSSSVPVRIYGKHLKLTDSIRM